MPDEKDRPTLSIVHAGNERIIQPEANIDNETGMVEVNRNMREPRRMTRENLIKYKKTLRETNYEGWPYRAIAVAIGEITLADLDARELAYHFVKNEDGDIIDPTGFKRQGFQPSITDAMDKELVRRFEQDLKAGFLPAVRSLIKLAVNARSEYVRMMAAEKIIDRNIGAVPQQIISVGGSSGHEVLSGYLMELLQDEQAKTKRDDDVIEGEIAE